MKRRLVFLPVFLAIFLLAAQDDTYKVVSSSNAQEVPSKKITEGPIAIKDAEAHFDASSMKKDVDASVVIEGEELSIPAMVDKGKQIYNAAKTRNWLLFSSLIIFLAMAIAKSMGLFMRIGKRWAYISVGALSIIAMVLSKLAGGLNWAESIFVVLSGPGAAFLNDIIKRGIMGKESKTPIKPDPSAIKKKV